MSKQELVKQYPLILITRGLYELFGEMKNFLIKNHIYDVCVACPAAIKFSAGMEKAFTVKSEAFIAGKIKVSRPPFTYLNRIRLKARLKKTVNASVIRERTFIYRQEGLKKG